MMLRPKFGKCIWCMCLLTSDPDADDSATKEHIFPECVFGDIKTKDCCKKCNSWLGADVDKLLLKDERIVLAARAAGISEDELLARYSGAGLDFHNRQVQYSVKEGNWRLEPAFHSGGFRIGMIDGQINPGDLQNAKRKLEALVKADASLQLSPPEIAAEVEKLFTSFQAGDGKTSEFSEKIKQRLVGVAGPPSIKLDGKFTPYETELAVAKIAYETGTILLPPEVYSKVGSALLQVRAFVLRREAGKSIFAFESSKPAQRCHSATLRVSADTVRFEVTLFGRASWELIFGVDRMGSSAQLDDLEVTLLNEFPKSANAVCKVSINGMPANLHS